MVLQTTYQDKATQTENKDEDTIEKLLKAITTLCIKWIVWTMRYKS